MLAKPRVIIDTNILISRALTPDSFIASAVSIILDRSHVMVSQETMDEFMAVLERISLKGYVTKNEISDVVGAYKEAAEWVPIIHKVKECRDPHDDKFLSLALNGHAEYLITGDKDLLVLHPFKNTKILTTKAFVVMLLE